MAVYKCAAGPESTSRATQGKTVEKLRVGDRSDLLSDDNLRRVVHKLHKDFLEKREYKYADNPTTRVMTFQQPETGGENQARQSLDRLRCAQSLQQIESEATDLASQYRETHGVRAGVLLFLVSRGEVAVETKEKVAEDCAFIFKCDFEPVSEVAPEELFHRIEDAIVEKAQKAAVYPRFDPEVNRFDDTVVRIFDDKGETQYWLDYLQLGKRKFEHVSQGDALRQVLDQDHREILDKHEKELQEPPRRRPLDDRGRSVTREVRLSTPQVKKVAQKVTQTTGRTTTVSFSLGSVRVTAPEDQYGRTWIVAEEGDQRYVLIKGDRLEAKTGMPTVLDVARFETLKKAAKRLGIDCK